MTFTFVIHGVVAEEHVDMVKDAMLKLMPEGRNAPGIIRFEYYRSKEKPSEFWHHAVWESEADHKRFNKTAAHDEFVDSVFSDGIWAESSIQQTILRTLE